MEQISEGLLDKVFVDSGVHQARVGAEPVEGAFKLADVMDKLGNAKGDIARDLQPLLLGFKLEDGNPRLNVWDADVGDKPPLHPGYHSF